MIYHRFCGITQQINRFDTIGAEILGVDVNTLSDADFDKIYQTWLDCNVICVRDQSLAIGEYLTYSQRFGVISPHPSKSTRHPDCPEVTLLGINKFNTDGTLNNDIYRRGGEGFHTDGSYEAVPFKATQLYAVAIPSRGGDTFFSSAYAAYDATSKPLMEDFTKCRACHMPLAQKDFVHRYDEYFDKRGRM